MKTDSEMADAVTAAMDCLLEPLVQSVMVDGAPPEAVCVTFQDDQLRMEAVDIWR